MVTLRRVVALFFVLNFASPAHAGNYRFLTQCNKTEIYVGESTTCHFILYGDGDFVEAEVAKFPEFRGFWSENVALRQNRMSFSQAGMPPGAALIGTYVICPMLGEAHPHIEPLKLVVRDPYTNEEVTLASQDPALTIKPLPPLLGIFAEGFKGAVGRFNLNPETTVVPFQNNEPFTVRYLLQGEGNFNEINELPITLPEKAEIISRKSYMTGFAQFPSKTFEITMTVPATGDVALPESTFVYFDLSTNRYETLQIAGVSLRYTPLDLTSDVGSERLAPRPERTWRPFVPAEKDPRFWIFQVVWALVLGIWISRKKIRARVPVVPGREKIWAWSNSITKLDPLSPDLFKRSDQIAFEMLLQTLDVQQSIPTRQQLLEQLETNGKFGVASLAREIFAAYENSNFRPDKITPDPQRISSALRDLEALSKAG